jgi:DNA-binding transcriptional regulator YhcF (GntR family)
MAQSPFQPALDRDSDVSLGTQLAWQLRAAIAAGVLHPGDRLPPVRELAGSAGVNVNTVRAVYARLAEQGVIVSEQGRGTFVRHGVGGGAGLGELADRAARDALRSGVDPRELAAVLYARADRPVEAAMAAAEEDAGREARRGLRLEIEALEHELATIARPAEPGAMAGAREAAAITTGARLVSTHELERTRDRLAERVTALRAELRAARATARAHTGGAPAPAQRRAQWPELLASGLGRPLAPEQ